MNYYKDTPPLDFISDVYDIMKDGDCLSPEKLNMDVVDMLGKYLSAQQGVQRTCATCGAIDMFSDDVCIECGASR